METTKNFNADNAKQISAAVTNYGNDSLRTSCWSLRMRRINNSLGKLPATIRSAVLGEIHFLQCLTSKFIFTLGMGLFLNKYIDNEDTKVFQEHFKNLYVEEKQTGMNHTTHLIQHEQYLRKQFSNQRQVCKLDQVWLPYIF
ncbi:hypothetical protein DMUE_5599 [Dictyocoela muelleri]|nr:hypothetical protein DMUE_5599 [Dictyocoela muelleri]